MHASATTGLVVKQGIEMPEDGLTQDILDLQYRTTSRRLLDVLDEK
jgi:hypothetical protein